MREGQREDVRRAGGSAWGGGHLVWGIGDQQDDAPPGFSLGAGASPALGAARGWSRGWAQGRRPTAHVPLSPRFPERPHKRSIAKSFGIWHRIYTERVNRNQSNDRTLTHYPPPPLRAGGGGSSSGPWGWGRTCPCWRRWTTSSQWKRKRFGISACSVPSPPGRRGGGSREMPRNGGGVGMGCWGAKRTPRSWSLRRGPFVCLDVCAIA